ncbi:MAG: antibiotic biosynthesis monooxygenase [Acidaminococcales bacterium]|jgi:quinol monooxygenase YgiN|nr:antibiotic biosynthesis monooxygenase [Acidaminococcales bacterium]
MVVVLAKIPVKPERQAEFIAMAQPVIAATRKEKGNISYTLYKSTENEYDLIYVEEWESKSDLALHLKSRHLQKFREARAGLMAGETSAKVYEIAKTAGR